MSKVIYLTCIENILFSGVLRGQVVELLKALKKNAAAFDITLVSLIPVHNYLKYRRRRKQLKAEFIARGLRFIAVPLLFLTRDFYIRRWLLPLYLVQALPIFIAILMAIRPQLVHARSYPASLIAALVKKISGATLIFDMKGLYVDEALMTHQFNAGSGNEKMWRAIENYIIARSDLVVGVSPAFKTFLGKRLGDTAFDVIPCSVDDAEFRIDERARLQRRAELKLDERWIIVVSGSLGAWSAVRTIVNIFEQLRSIDQRAFLLILTQTVDPSIETSLLQLGRENFAVLNLAPEDVPGTLSVGDLALLVRERSIVNDVGLTVKFGEYLSSGVPVIVTETAGDAARLVNAYQCGIVIKDELDVEFKSAVNRLISFKEMYRQNGLRLVEEYLSLRAIARRVNELYVRLLCASSKENL
ncbi:glycosyltransferase [candidate division KSB1 bacterium]|nr:glycosyltransferase [candidate division KSB1 bacterium]